MLVGVALEGKVEQIEVPEQDLLRFPRGLIGFEELTRFALFELAPPLYLLQTVDDPHVSFLLLDPFHLDPSYRAELSPEECETLELEEGDQRALMCLVTLSPAGTPQSVNLRAPIALNSTRKLGIQAILQEGRYRVRHPLIASPQGDWRLNNPRQQADGRHSQGNGTIVSTGVGRC